MEKENMQKFVSPDGKYMAVYTTRDNREDEIKRDEIFQKKMNEEKAPYGKMFHLSKEEQSSFDISNVVVAIMEKNGNDWKKVDVIKWHDSEVNYSCGGQHKYCPGNCPKITSVGRNHLSTENYNSDYNGYTYNQDFIRSEKGEWLSAALGNPNISHHVMVTETEQRGQVYFFDAKNGTVEDTGFKRPMLWSHLDYMGIGKDGFTCATYDGEHDDDPYSPKNFMKHAYIKRQKDGSYKEDFVSKDFIIKCEFADNAYFTTPNLRTGEDKSLFIDGKKIDDGICAIIEDAYIKSNGAVMKIGQNNSPELFGSITGEYSVKLGNAVISEKDNISYINIIDKKGVLEAVQTPDRVSISSVFEGTHELVTYETEDCESAIVLFNRKNGNVNKVYTSQDIGELAALGEQKEAKYEMKYSREIDLLNKKGRGR